MRTHSSPRVRLGDFMLRGGGSTDPSKYPADPFVLYSIPAFDAGQPQFVLGKEIGSPKKNVEPGDILLSQIVPHIRRSWIVSDHNNDKIIASNEWIVFRSKGIFAPYLRHYLVSDVFHPRFMKTVAGVGGSLLRAKPAQVADIDIPLPPPEEQRRIAAILDNADTLRRKRKRGLELLDGLTQSIFREMFGDPAVNPRGYQLISFRSLSTKISDGPFGSNLKSDHYVDEGVRVIRLQNIGVDEFVDNDRAFISKEHFGSLSKHECLPGDILVGTLGDPNLRACVQPLWLHQALNKADCVQMRVDPRKAVAEYVVALINHPSTEAMAQGSIMGQTRARISMGRFRELRVPTAPLRSRSNSLRFTDR